MIINGMRCNLMACDFMRYELVNRVTLTARGGERTPSKCSEFRASITQEERELRRSAIKAGIERSLGRAEKRGLAHEVAEEIRKCLSDRIGQSDLERALETARKKGADTAVLLRLEMALKEMEELDPKNGSGMRGELVGFSHAACKKMF